MLPQDYPRSIIQLPPTVFLKDSFLPILPHHIAQVVHVLQVEQRSELVDVVTRLAKEEAAAEKGAAAAAKTDAASGTAAVAADKPDLISAQAASKRNAAAALKQVYLLEQPVLTWQTLAQTTCSCFVSLFEGTVQRTHGICAYCTLILIVRLLVYGKTA